VGREGDLFGEGAENCCIHKGRTDGKGKKLERENQQWGGLFLEGI